MVRTVRVTSLERRCNVFPFTLSLPIALSSDVFLLIGPPFWSDMSSSENNSTPFMRSICAGVRMR